MRHGAMLVIECFENKTQLVIEFVGSRDGKFVHQIVKPVRLDNKMRAPEFLGQGVDYFRKVLRLCQVGFSKGPHLLQHNL